MIVRILPWHVLEPGIILNSGRAKLAFLLYLRLIRMIIASAHFRHPDFSDIIPPNQNSFVKLLRWIVTLLTFLLLYGQAQNLVYVYGDYH